MSKTYPKGAITSYAELLEVTDVYEGSKKFHSVSRLKRVNSLTVACLLDMNIPANDYSDWFLFSNENDAREYAGY